jgi:uncharacterized protein YceH (UPF0502 family)
MGYIYINVKESLLGRVTETPKETRNCVRFMARFAPFEETEVTVEKPTLKHEARLVVEGDRIVIKQWASIGELKIRASDLTRLVHVGV